MLVFIYSPFYVIKLSVVLIQQVQYVRIAFIYRFIGFVIYSTFSKIRNIFFACIKKKSLYLVIVLISCPV